MKQIKRLLLAGLLVGIMVVLAGCGTPAEEAGGQPAVPLSIECLVAYRPSVTEGLSESTVTLATGGDQETIAFDELQFNAQYWDDAFEGRSLVVSVANPDTGKEITRHLYQMDRGQGPVNQFIGGHGFTGLIYVYHPSSGAELQYFCEGQ